MRNMMPGILYNRKHNKSNIDYRPNPLSVSDVALVGEHAVSSSGYFEEREPNTFHHWWPFPNYV